MFPVKLRILPQFIFNSRDPIVMGVCIDAGVLRQGTPLCVPSKGVSHAETRGFFFFFVLFKLKVDFICVFSSLWTSA